MFNTKYYKMSICQGNIRILIVRKVKIIFLKSFRRISCIENIGVFVFRKYSAVSSFIVIIFRLCVEIATLIKELEERTSVSESSRTSFSYYFL